MSIPIAILGSGRGSNFDAITRAGLDIQVVAVVSDQSDAPILEKARQAGHPTHCVEAAGLSRVDHERKILEVLSKAQPRFLVMAGYMRIVTATLLEPFRSDRGYARVVNIHPSLLPSFPGVRAYEQAFRFGSKVAGVTVHLVDLDVDNGPICAQESFDITDCRTAEEVEQRGLKVEHRLFPQTLKWVLPEAFTVSNADCAQGRFHVRPN